MEISETDIQNTVLELFASRGLEEGDMMWLSRLETFWLETRLRRQDLLNGVAQLCSKGLLDLEELDGQTGLSLTSEGRRRATEVLGAGVGYWSRYLREELLPAVRVVAKPGAPVGPGRREYESSNAPEIPWSRNSR